ncbi:MAG TPA: hypothetical protein VM845_04160 [Burkholderiaceae bacterium]|nr:hypothetical protein [Burkholderiaceae bacterium]
MRRFYAALIVVALMYPIGVLASGAKQALMGALVGGIVTVGTALLLGLTMALWFLHKGWFKAWQAVCGGGCIGALVAMIFALDPLTRPLSELLPALSGIGALHGLAFWVLAFFRNAALVARSRAQRSGGSAERAA